MLRGTFQDEGFAQVDFDGRASYPMPQDEYEAQHIQPPFDQLPTRKEYLSQKPKGPREDQAPRRNHRLFQINGAAES